MAPTTRRSSAALNGTVGLQANQHAHQELTSDKRPMVKDEEADKEKEKDFQGVFQKGVAISVWQNSGDDGDSNWSRHARSKWPLRNFGVNACRGKFMIHESHSDFWNRYEEDIALTAKLGCNSFRLSIEWNRIEPQRGQFDQAAIDRYHKILDCLAEHKLEPNATLHHFVHPGWFEDLGAFAKIENVPVFTAWAVKAYELFGSRIRLWATFNEPTCYMFLGFIIGIAPPGHFLNLVGAGRMLHCMLQCHTAAYKAIKAMPGGASAQIGLVSHHINFLPQGKGISYIAANWMSKWLTYWWGWDVVDHWMHTGEFTWKLPGVGLWIKEQDPGGRPPCDWWGINYYSRCVLTWHLQPSVMASEVMSDMYYPVYPEGLYIAIKRSSKYGIPMYITETGIADARDDRRAVMIDAYFKEVLRAIGEGMDVRGFYYWTLLDNFEWATGYEMKFGLYGWEPDGSVDRKLKEGSRPLIRFYQTLPNDLQELRRTIRKAAVTLGPDLGVGDVLEAEGYTPMQDVDQSQRTGVMALG